LGDDDFVVVGAALEMEEFHADGLGGKDTEEMICAHAILADEAFEDMETLWGEHEDATLFEEVRVAVGGIFDEAGVHEVLGHGLCHIAGHGEGGCSGGGNNARRFTGIWAAVRLLKLEVGEVLGGFITGWGSSSSSSSGC
jgi:hypothetical protein